MRLKSEIKKIDSELLFKSSTIKHRDKEITTPIKAGYKSNPISDVNEIYKEFSLERIEQCDRDDKEERKANREINSLQTAGVNFFIVNYTSRTVPTKNHIEFLSDIQYSHSDVVITPIWSIIKSYEGEKRNEAFLSLTNQYIEVSETQNDRSIWGMLPTRMPRVFLDSLVENYIKREITSFVVDFDGRSIDGASYSWLRKLTRLISSNDLTDECVLYSINASEGKFMKQATEIPAKDFMSIGYGMDILGLNHTRIHAPRQVWDEIKAAQKENTYRIFDREAYGYRKASEIDAKRLQISNANHRKDYNTKQQHAETLVLQERLEAADSIKPYISEKSQSSKYIGKMANMRKLYKD
jgi:hypothetical protein